MGNDEKNIGYKYYTLKVSLELRDLFERYIKKYKSLGFNNVAQFASHILQEKAIEIVKDNPDLEN